ncbi:MAG: L-threonylcarbamoyladenylate synthase [Bacteroidota bacterium]|nr:L-threonylcarbamoyladenylate synthase [Bacteroidota bacterium]
MLIRIYPENPSERHIRQVVEVLQKGGVIIYPTDGVYGIGCDITQHRAIERVARIRGVKTEKANFSFICHDLSQLSDFTSPLRNEVFKLMKRNLPGPFTFILKANNNVPKLLKNKRKNVGIRVPDNSIAREIVLQLGNPILSTSVHDMDEIIEYTTDPELIHERYGDLVDLVIDGGYGNNIPSAIIDCSSDEIDIVREGIKDLE